MVGVTMRFNLFFMEILFILLSVGIVGIGVLMISKYYKKGLFVPPVLSGIAFLLVGIAQLITVL